MSGADGNNTSGKTPSPPVKTLHNIAYSQDIPPGRSTAAPGMEDYAPSAHHRSPQLTRAAELQLTRSSELPPGMTSQSTAVGVIAPNNFVASSAGGAAANSTGTTHSLDLQVDFTRPDGNRTRPLLIDGKRLYVDEHYVSVWSPILRSWCIECPDRELILANVQYEHVLELLLAIHPTYKDIDDQTVHILLPLAFDYQMEGLLHRCECFLINHKMPFLEKVWLADRYKLNRLLALLLRELRPNHKLDLSGARYHGLSDRVKVLLLERMHGSPPPEELPEPPIDMEHFLSATDINFAMVRAKTGRSYYVNPYYLAAWSTVFQERLCSMMNVADDIYCPCTHEELKYFLMAIYPPQLRINESNIGPILMAASKMESQGLLRKCAQILLTPQTQLSVFVRLSLLDRCKLQDLLDQCMTMVVRPEHLVEMTQQQTYECLSVRARAAMMDRLASLLQRPGFQPHACHRCKTYSSCYDVVWMCPQCKTYSSESKSAAPQAQPIMPLAQTVAGAVQVAGSPHHAAASKQASLAQGQPTHYGPQGGPGGVGGPQTMGANHVGGKGYR